MLDGHKAAFLLDRRWSWMRGEMECSKEPDLALVTTILADRRVGPSAT